MPSAADIERVWKEWVKRQKRPELCQFTKDRVQLITARMKLGYTADDLCALIRYAYESTDRLPMFWQGNNETGQTYLGLTNLLVIAKLGDRVQAAKEWAEKQDGTAPPAQPSLLSAGEPSSSKPAERPIPRGRSIPRLFPPKEPKGP